MEKVPIIVSMMAEHQLKDDDISTDVSTEYDSPAESAAAMEAAAWASSKHQGKLPPEEHPKIGGKAFRIVHASVGLTGYGCPPEMIRLAISVHPNQVREMDEEGRLPIHIAAVGYREGDEHPESCRGLCSRRGVRQGHARRTSALGRLRRLP